jgi:hypothetical protein
MGIYLSKWFTAQNHQYRPDCPTLGHHIEVPDEEKKNNPFYLVHNWPIPMTWTRMMFQPNTWDSLVRQFGAAASKMGPVTFGTQRFTWYLQKLSKCCRIEGLGYCTPPYQPVNGS